MAAVVVALILLPACVDKPDTTPGRRAPRHISASTSADPFIIDVASGQSNDIVLNGTGWATLSVYALTDVILNVTVSNPQLPDLFESASPQVETTYSAGNFTVVYLFRVGEFPLGPQSYSFEILGEPRGASVTQSRPAQIELRHDTTARLIVATTVPGYRIELTDTTLGQGYEMLDVELRPHSELSIVTPAPTEASGQKTPAAETAHRQVWTTGPIDVGPALLRSWSWIIEMDVGSGRAMAWHQTLGFGQPPTAPFTGEPQYGFSGPSSSRGNSAHAVELERRSTEMYWILETTAAGAQNTLEGASFLVVPLG